MLSLKWIFYINNLKKEKKEKHFAGYTVKLYEMNIGLENNGLCNRCPAAAAVEHVVNAV